MHFFYAIINRLPPPDRCRKGGVLLMDDIFSFILSIIFTINNITLEITTIAGIPRPNIALIIKNPLLLIF